MQQLRINNFQRFLALIEPLKAQHPEAEFEVSEPALQSGFRILTIDFPDNFSVEVEWKSSRGFGLIAGREMFLGEGVHELYVEPVAAADRVSALVAARKETTGTYPVSLAELRKLRGQMQKDVALQLGMTKSGLAQIEANASSGKVQVDTLQRLVSSLGGRLVISAMFPDGTERRVTVGS
jgi:DNA-binding XRE family transcriptional regulator